jgi:hypothetical protein
MVKKPTLRTYSKKFVLSLEINHERFDMSQFRQRLHIDITGESSSIDTYRQGLETFLSESQSPDLQVRCTASGMLSPIADAAPSAVQLTERFQHAEFTAAANGTIYEGRKREYK